MIRSGYIAGQPDGGPACETLERALEDYYSVPYARVFSSGTSALHAALIGVGIRQTRVWAKRRRVLVPAYSMSATATSVLHAGALPIFADIRHDTYSINWDDIDRRKVSKKTRFKAAILVHLFGYHAPYPNFSKWPIVHDCAQSPSVRPVPHRGHDVWVYSLNQHKVIQCGEGGYALTWRKDIADAMHAVRNHGEHTSGVILGWNYRMTEMQAEIALKELDELDERLRIRRAICGHFWPGDTNQDWYIAVARGVQVPGVTPVKGYVKPIYSLPYFQYNHLTRGAPCPVTEEIERNMVYYKVSDLVDAYAKDFSSYPSIRQPRPAGPVPFYPQPANVATG